MRRGGAGKERRHESASELKARQRLQHLENELRRPAPGVVDDEGSASEAEVAPNRRLGPAEVEEMAEAVELEGATRLEIMRLEVARLERNGQSLVDTMASEVRLAWAP